MQMQQMQQMQMPSYQQPRPTAYSYPAPPQQQQYAPPSYQVSYASEVQMDDSNDTKDWNHQENEACLMMKARFCESERELLNKRHMVVECKGNTALLKQLVQHRKGVQADISGNIHKGVMIKKIVAIGMQSTLPHATGVRFSDITNFNYIDGPTGEGFSVIIPANLPNYTFVNMPPLYEANKDAEGALAAKYGGIDFDKLKREIVQMSENSPCVYVPKHSIAVKAAIDAHMAIKMSGTRSERNGKTRIEPRIEFVPGTNQLVEIEGKISMSTEFFNGFLRSVQENVMSVTKPVDLDCLEMSFFNTNYGHCLASREGTLFEEDRELNPKTRHEVTLDFIVYFNTRQDM